MKTSPLRGGIAVALTATVVLGGCSSGTASSDQDESAATPTVDLDSLDTGDFATEPHGDFGHSDEATMTQFDAQRLTEFTAFPVEIDPLYEASDELNIQIHTSVEDGYGSATQNEVKTELGWDFGTVGSGYANAPDDDPKDQLFFEISHFPDEESAAEAAVRMGEMERDREALMPGAKPLPVSRTPVEIPRYPDAVATTEISRVDPEDDTLQVLSYSTRGEFVVRTSVTAPQEDQDRAVETVARTLDMQNPLLDQFTAASTSDSEEPSESDVNTMIDQGEVIRYALPEPSKPQYVEGSAPGEYGPRGFGHLSRGGPRMVDILNTAGVQHIGVWGSTVFRAGDEERATRLDEDLKDFYLDFGFFEDEAPADIPRSACYFAPAGTNRVNQCLVIVGKYVGLVTNIGPVSGVHQELAAQYAILTQADQEA